MCTTSRVDGARKSSACHSVRLIEHAESDEASETASGAGASPASQPLRSLSSQRCGGAAQASARAKACMWKSIVRLARTELQHSTVRSVRRELALGQQRANQNLVRELHRKSVQ